MSEKKDNNVSIGLIVAIVFCVITTCWLCLLFIHAVKEIDRAVHDKTTKVHLVRSLGIKNEKSAKAAEVFSIGYGEYQENEYYVVCMEQDGGGYKIEKLDMDSVKLYFDATDANGAFVQYVANGMGYPVGDYELHVPKDTVQESFDLSKAMK